MGGCGENRRNTVHHKRKQTGNNQQQPGEKQDSNKSTDSQESESTIEQGLKLH